VGMIAKVMALTRVVSSGVHISIIKCNPGARPKTVPNYSAPGDDATPLKFDYCALLPLPGSGQYLCIGFADVKNAGKTAAGEKRIYARNSSGAAVSEVWLKNDGTILVSNGSVNFTIQGDNVTIENPGNILMKPGGNFEVDAGGNVVLKGARVDLNP
jgi:hypothetical protein